MRCRRKHCVLGALTVVLLLLLVYILEDEADEFDTTQWRQSYPVLGGLRVGHECSEDERLPTFLTTPRCLKMFRRTLARSRRLRHAVPAIRHVLWKDEMIPEHTSHHLLSWTRLHPNWTYVLWRDVDLKLFIEKYFPGKLLHLMEAFEKDGSIKIMDLMRYAILFRFGGVCADLDYKLVSGIDEFRRLPALLIREPELHSIQMFGLNRWPPKLLLMNSLMMAMPGHSFMDFCVSQLAYASPRVRLLEFAGPIALTTLAEKYNSIYPVPSIADQTIYIPPSFSFNGYPGNSLSYTPQQHVWARMRAVWAHCWNLWRLRTAQTDAFCNDPTNLNLITNPHHKVYGMHDYNSSGSAHFITNSVTQVEGNRVDIRQLIPNCKVGSDLF